MKRIHLLRYRGEPGALTPLLQAARGEGLRVGWLDLPGEGPAPLPPSLEAASSAGAFRSVAVGGRHSVAVKLAGGPPVLRDLLREHFLGCALVVVRRVDEPGEGASRMAADLAAVPELTVGEGEFRVTPPGEAGRAFQAPVLAARLRRPRPW